MATTSNKQAFLDRAVTALKKKYPPAADDERRPVLEHLVYAICREGETTPKANAAFDRLRKRFFDWNEVRVSSVHEVQEALGDLDGAGEKARRIIGVLQEIFELNFSFDLDDIDKNGLKKAATKLSRFNDVNDFVLAWVVQKGLGGHAIPLDDETTRVLTRLGVIETEAEDAEATRCSIEHMVPKARGALFVEVFSQHADKMCTAESPACPECPLKKDCPAGQEFLRGEATAAKATRAKPR